jgi:Protein kinase domain
MTFKTVGDAPGELFGDRYRIERLLGKRSGRRTYLARDLKTYKQVVIKRLIFGEDFEWDDLKLFEREAAVLRSLSHPAIPRYLDYFDLDLPSGKGFALVQAYINASSLEAHLQANRSFHESDVIALAKAILEILIYLHDHDPAVVHRDIKPSNLLSSDLPVSTIGEVYLVDFGSVALPKSSNTITVVGTYGYMPPEQFGGRTVPASDLYSLGATLIYLLTGQHPADLPQVDQQLQFTPLTPISPGLTRWLQRMVQPSLNRRFTSAHAALEALTQPALSAEITQRPANSKILLKKEAQNLEILLPPGRTNPIVVAGLAFMGLFAIAWNSFIMLWTGMALLGPLPINLFFALFSLPFWAVGIGMASTVIFGLFGQMRLRLNDQQICQQYELFGFKRCFPRPSPRQDITRIELVQRHYKKDSDGDRVEVKPQLIVWAGGQTYCLGKGGSVLLSDAEIEWLAAELSDWLGLSIDRT